MMRRFVASALVLLPVLAHGQASTSTTLQAKVVAPAPLMAAAATSNTSAAALPPAEAVMVPVNETVIDNTPAIEPSSQFGTIAGAPIVAPKLLKSTPITLSLADMRSQSEVSTVTVHIVVDRKGQPTDLTITRSAGAAIDRRALQAVSQYRFQPATQNGITTDYPVDVQIKLKKS